MVGEDDVAIVEVLEVHALRASQDIHRHCHRHTAFLQPDALDLALTAPPVVDQQGDTVAYGHLAEGLYGFAEEHFQLPIQDGGS